MEILGLQVIAAHLCGDYILQNDWMAQGKKTSSFVCTVHVLVYMLGFTLLTMAGKVELWQWAMIASQHWVQDRTSLVRWWMKTIRQPKFMEPPMAPWSFIAVDNSIHLVWVALVMSF